MVHQRADVLLLGIFATTASLGIYVVAYQSVEPILILASAGAATILALGHGRPEVEGGGVTARLIRETLLVGGITSSWSSAYMVQQSASCLRLLRQTVL